MKSRLMQHGPMAGHWRDVALLRDAEVADIKHDQQHLFIGIILGGLGALPLGFALGVYYLPILVASEGAVRRACCCQISGDDSRILPQLRAA